MIRLTVISRDGGKFMAETADSVKAIVGSTGKTADRALSSRLNPLKTVYRAVRRSVTKAYVKHYANKAYQNSREYAKSGADFAGRMGNGLNELARKQPVITMVGVLAAGY